MHNVGQRGTGVGLRKPSLEPPRVFSTLFYDVKGRRPQGPGVVSTGKAEEMNRKTLKNRIL